jgi:hypothetical protein
MRIRRLTSQHSTYPRLFPRPGWEPERARSTPICYSSCYSERTRQLQDTQKKWQRAGKEPGFSRNNPDDTQSHSDKQKRDNNLEDKVLFHYKYKCYKIYKIHNSPEGCPTSQLSYSWLQDYKLYTKILPICSNSPRRSHLPPTEGRTIENRTKDPITEFLYKKKLDICSGAAGYISSYKIFSFYNDKNSRPSSFLF